jgi:hypothetical protein
MRDQQVDGDLPGRLIGVWLPTTSASLNVGEPAGGSAPPPGVTTTHPIAGLQRDRWGLRRSQRDPDHGHALRRDHLRGSGLRVSKLPPAMSIAAR